MAMSAVPFDRAEMVKQQIKDPFSKAVMSDLEEKLESDFSNKFEILEGLLLRRPMKK